MKSLSSLALCTFALTVAACSSPSVPDGSIDDASADRSTIADSGARPDGSSAMDVASQPDAMSSMDVPPLPDAMSTMDVASQPDAINAADAAQDSAAAGCRSNAECPGRACLGITACGATGTCGGPTPCDAIVDPVCGCDGRTYSNSCVANNAGVGVRSRGACAAADAGSDASTTGCRSNADCTGREACRGIATCGGTGTCMAPGPCPLVFAPVCGCDGVTYGNTCELSNAGIGLRSVGACPTADASTDSGSSTCRVNAGCCASDADCRGSGYCAPAESCAGGVATSVCKTRPSGANQCWRNSDCPSGGGRLGVCSGARICPCGAMCIIADAPGTCS